MQASLSKKVQWITFTALFASLIYGLQMAMVVLPNIQFTAFLILIYSVRNNWKNGFILVCVHMILHNLIWGFSVEHIIMWIAWLYIPTGAVIFKLDTPYSSAPFILVFSFLYMFSLDIFSAWLYGLPLLFRVSSGIYFTLIFAINNFLMTLWLFSPTQKLFDILEKKELKQNGKTS